MKRIKTILLWKGLTYKALIQCFAQRKIKVSPSQLSQVIHGTRKTRKIREVLAEILEIKVEEFWGE